MLYNKNGNTFNEDKYSEKDKIIYQMSNFYLFYAEVLD